MLVKAGANLDAADKDGKTALMMAIDYGHTATAEMLVKAGANLDLQNQVSDQQSSKTWLRADLATGRRPGSPGSGIAPRAVC